VALAEAFRPTLLLLGRGPALDDEPEWLAPLESEAEIKRALAARANGHATPQLIGERFREVAAGRAIRSTLARIEAHGAKVVYHQVDIRDEAAVRRRLELERAKHGPIRGLIHGAGVLADRHIVDQTDEQFANVFDTKVAGLESLLGAVSDDELKVLVLFSSTTARLGRVGQAAYAAANEALNKKAQSEARRRPACRVRSLNWGPWKGGMVTSSLETVFASEGIGLIPLEAGAGFVVEELRAARPGDRCIEVMVLGEGTVPSPLSSHQTNPRTSASAWTKVFERPLDVDALPVLRSHVIDGRGVVPMALLLEWMAQGAVQRNPGLDFLGVDGLKLLKGAISHEEQPETLAVLVGRAVREGDVFRVPVEVRGARSDGVTLTHVCGEVVLAEPAQRDAPRRTIDPTALDLPEYSRSLHSVYHEILFHGPVLQSIERIDGLGKGGYTGTARTGAPPASWIERPLRQTWLSDPLALDSAFQLMTLWSYEHADGPSLPTQIGSYRQYRPTFPTPRVAIVARARRPSANRETADIEFVEADGSLVASIEMYECISVASLNQSFRRNRLPRARVAPGAR
jgi:NAD(P)-dependent dehydrogenase (short-subunit alcohol dehydrogenase family)